MALSNDEIQRLLHLYNPREHKPDPVKARKRLHRVWAQREVAPIDAARTLRYIRQHPEVVPHDNTFPPWLSNHEERKVRPFRNIAGRIVGLPEGAPASELDLDYNSSAIDCLVMVTKLLEVGYFSTDRGGLSITEWEAQLNHLVRGLNSLFLTDFMCFDVETLLDEKMLFFDSCFDTLKKQEPKISYLRPQNVARLRSEIYLNTPSPFRFHAANYGRCHTCRCQYKLTDPTPTHFLPLPDVEVTSSIAALLIDTFRPQDYHEGGVEGFQCKNASPHPIEQLHLHVEPDLPDVMALTSNHWRHTGDSTPQELSFRYECTDHRVVDAKYRWLGGIYFNATDERYKVFWRGQEEDGDTALLEYDSSMEQCMAEVLAVSDNPNDMIPKDWWIERALVFLERIYDRGETRSKCLERLRKELDLRVRHYKTYDSNTADPSAVAGNTTETDLPNPAALVVEVDQVDVDCQTQRDPSQDEDTVLREPDEATTAVDPTDSGDTLFVASVPADSSVTIRKRAIRGTPKRKADDITTAGNPLDTIVVASHPAGSSATLPEQAVRDTSQRDLTKFWRGNPAFPLVKKTRPRSQPADNLIADKATSTAVDDDENPFRASHKPRAPPREKEPSPLGVYNTNPESLRLPSGRSRLNAPNPVNYGAISAIQEYLSGHGMKQDDLSIEEDPSDLIPIYGQRRGAGSKGDPDDWHYGQPLLFRKADS